MSSINGDMSAAMWKTPDRHESLKKIEYIEGDWQTIPISLLHQLSDHLDHEGDVDFASTLWPKKDPIRLDRTNQGKAAKYQLEGAANDQKLKAARFSYSAGKTKKQSTVVGVPDEQDPTRIEPVIVRHRKGHSVCNPGGMSGWDGNKQEIWRPIHKRSEANEGPERTILRITERKDPIVRPAPSASAIEQPVAASEPDQHLGNQQETCGDAGCEQQDSSPAREDQSANEDRLQLGKRKRSDSAISIASSIKSEPTEDSIYNPLGQHLQREDVAQRARDEDEETQCTTDSGPDPAVQHSLSQNPTSFDTFDPDFSQRTSLASSATTVVGSTPSTPTPPASKPIDRRYKNVGVIFFDINNQVRQGYNLPFSECSSARDLFDAARVAKVADKHTRTLEVQIGIQTGTQIGKEEAEHVRRDNQSDFKRHVLEKLENVLARGRHSKVVVMVKKDM
ncbi:hypothetical protein PMZ80_007676 [Knufia obscura]|uniref:Uncharacterized protein n=1 Tax=Knufia obscura TaxID=1635080 RepID=A0ABR0RHZ7_9EURO|nr:hypothetical protein PMZ80_007676 [Knufia obscura]